MGDLSEKRFEDLDIRNVDKDVRRIVVALNRFSFLETITSCQGHPSENYGLDVKRYSIGYIVGRRVKNGLGYETLVDGLRKFVEYRNTGGDTQFKFQGDVDFWLTLIPGKLEDLSTGYTGEEYIDFSTRREMRKMGRKMRSSWKQLETFLRDYQL